ncbi:MAG: radical SAM protein, partial [Oscillospiraceae bacterium]|nr:radical SAM protein [Oscillospiraceae bacterium]
MQKHLQTSPFLVLTQGKDIYNLLSSNLVEINDAMFSILKQSKNRIQYDELLKLFDENIIKILIDKKLLLFEDELWTTTNIEILEIETCTHCNRRCLYCPVSLAPKEAKTMSMELFNLVLLRAEKNGKIKTIAFNFYNEPTIDRYFEERILKLSQTNIKLSLHTNAIELDQKKIELLKNSNVLSAIYFNIPSINKEVFERMTGSLGFEKAMDNI